MGKRPDWLTVRYKAHPNHEVVNEILAQEKLHTICREAVCPNFTECFSKKTATFLIMGTACTRSCRFCNVTTATPTLLDPEEPMRLAKAVVELGLRHVVITSVTRDDLPDGGAAHFAAVIRSVKQMAPQAAVEVLVPDFGGNMYAIDVIAAEAPDVVGHNVETVAALYATVRPEAVYERSLAFLQYVKQNYPKIRTKSGIMLGFGETQAQVLALFDDLSRVGCDFLTIGQYLSPTKMHHPVVAYITPEQFEQYGEMARERGFLHVASAPFVRSSYNASEALQGEVGR